ncbi:Lrp/AsnC family transcriptional regulator [Streptosporangium sandarakinum]|uniref:Lrp/AsnC family transcriptional regulator n=1 Tax=Streptosporangium sandarakinum TaxID=1260955 RepID=UPI0037879098
MNALPSGNSVEDLSGETPGDLDSRLIAALRKDARLSSVKLAEQAGTTRAAVSAHLDRLRRSGRIRIIAAVNPELLGLSAYAHVAVRVSGSVDEVARRIAELRAAPFVSVTSGEYQIVTELRLPGQAELYGTMTEIRSIPGVERINSLIYLEVVGGTLMPSLPLADIALDSRDLALIELLQEDGRMSFAELAERVGLSPSATRSRVNSLIAQQVIRIAPVISRSRASDGVVAGIGLNLRDAADEIVARLMEAPQVEYFARTLGRHDAIATVAGVSTAELDGFINRLMTSEHVTGVTSWLHLRIVKERYEWPLPTLEELAARR